MFRDQLRPEMGVKVSGNMLLTNLGVVQAGCSHSRLTLTEMELIQYELSDVG